MAYSDICNVKNWTGWCLVPIVCPLWLPILYPWCEIVSWMDQLEIRFNWTNGIWSNLCFVLWSYCTLAGSWTVCFCIHTYAQYVYTLLYVCACVISAGVGLGWLCVHHQLDSAARLCPSVDGSLLKQVRRCQLNGQDIIVSVFTKYSVTTVFGVIKSFAFKIAFCLKSRYLRFMK